MRESLRLSWHVVRRNWWVYRKDFIANISPTVAEPMLTLMALGVGLGAFVAKVDGRSYSEFLAPGLVMSSAMFTAFFETSYGFFVRMTFENVFKAMLTTPIGVKEVVLGEFQWVALKSAMMATGVSLVLIPFGLMGDPTLVWLVPIAGALVGVPLGAMGLIATCYVRNINQFQTIYAFLIAPLYFLSGIFFPVSQMPEYAQWVARALPLHHGVQLCQAIFWNQNVFSALGTHGPILILYGAALATFAHHKVKQKLEF